MKRQSFTHNQRKQAHIAVSRGYAMPVLTAISLSLLARIHQEIAPTLKAMRQADAILDGGLGSGMANKERVDKCELGSIEKYSHTYGMGRIPSNLASENDAFAASYRASMDKASENTRGIDNSQAIAS